MRRNNPGKRRADPAELLGRHVWLYEGGGIYKGGEVKVDEMGPYIEINGGREELKEGMEVYPELANRDKAITIKYQH
jgi:hypothetical protein